MTPLDLVPLLADGELHSGTSLGERLGITRAAVGRQIGHLAGYGLVIVRHRGRGYRLDAPLSLLDGQRINAALAAHRSRIGSVAVHASVASTNDVLGSTAGAVAACVAEHQSAGRGRRGRAWISPYGVNLYLSVRWPYACAPSALGALSLALGAGLAGVLEGQGYRVQVKWPNDLWLHRAKVGGILVDVRGDAQGPCEVTVGVGLNVNMTAPVQAPDQAWTSLARVSGACVDRSALAAALLMGVERVLDSFPQPGFAAYATAWAQRDALHGAQVCATWIGDTVCGTACGVAPDGSLRVRTAGGMHLLSGGDISVRAYGPAA